MTGTPPPPGNHEVAVVHEVPDGIELRDAHRRGRCDHLAPAAAGVLLERGARLVRKTHGLVFGRKRARGFRGILERGVVPQSTTVWVMRATDERMMSRRLSSFRMAWDSW